MVMISMGGEARTPSYHSMGSPRYGGCVGAFLHFFDWNPGKRFYSTKRLPASKPDEGLRRSRSLRSDHSSTARTRMIFDAQLREDEAEAEEGSSASLGASGVSLVGDDDGAASSRAPSVVARLMGLESLPKGPYQPSNTSRHRRSQSCSGAGELPFAFMTTRVDEPPVVLQELLQRDFKASRKTLRDRIPGFAKRAQEQYENRFTKKGAASKVLRCRQDECMSPYIDIPDVPKSKLRLKQPFLLRLAPTTSTPRDPSPSEVSMDEIAPELRLQGAGWPLAGKVSRESSFRSDRSSLLESECSSSRPAGTKSSKPALANVARKIFRGRRRTAGASWNGTEFEDSESNSSQVEADSMPARAPLQHRKPRVPGREAALKKVAKSLSPPPNRLDRTLRTKAANHHETSVREFKTSGTRIPAIPKPAQSLRTSTSMAKPIFTSEDVDDSGIADPRQPLIQSRSRSTDFQSTGVEFANSRTSSAASASQDSTSQTSNIPPTSTTSRSKGGRPVAKLTKISKPDAVSTTVPAKLVSKAPPLDGYRAPKVMRDGQKTGLPKGSIIPGYGTKLLGADKAKALKGGEFQGGVGSSKQSPKNTLQGIQRVRETMLANTAPPLGDRLKKSVEELATPSDIAPVVDDTDGGNITNAMAKSKHARARSIDDVFPELPLDSNAAFTNAPVPISAEVLKPPVVASEAMCEQVFLVDLQEFFAAGPDEMRWEEDERRVHSPELSGLFCERSCSGPSVSSASVDVSDVDDERNGDAWSSCASYNAADCDSPRTFELPDTDADECDLHENAKSAPMFVKTLATGMDEAAGQPSPVSILNSPFHDEAGTTSECTLNSDEDGFKSPGSNSRTGITDTETSPGPANHDKIRQALLDIALFQSFTFDYKESHTPKESEQGFVREVLSAANFMCTPGSSPNWFDQDVAIDPSLFDRMESGEIDDSNVGGGLERMVQSRSGGLWRCDRKLLFDCVNEAFALTLWRHWRRAESVPPGPQWCRPPPHGQKLVEEVYEKIMEWRKFTALSVDFLVERDMGRGDWKSFSADVAEVGLHIESMVWKAIVEEVVTDMVATLKPR